MCVARKDPLDKGKSPMQIFNTRVSFERLQIDILCFSTSRNRYLLVIVDCFKWVEAFPLKNVRHFTIADVFVNHI